MNRARRPLRAWVCALAIAGLAPCVAAQDTSVVAPGDPVRVSMSWHGLPRQTAWYFIGFRGDSLVLWNEKQGASVAVVPISAVMRFEVNHGDQPPRSQVKAGAIVGAGIGLATGIASAILYPCDSNTYLCNDTNLIVAFTAGGAIFGAVVGAFNPAPPYKKVDLRPRMAVTPLPGGRVGLGLQLGFQP